MKTVSLSGSLRENVGKKDAKALRTQKLVPCVVYGGEKQLHVAIEKTQFDPILFSPNSYIVELNVDNKNHTAILQDIQYHPVSDEILHADFLQISKEKPVIISIPVKIQGTSPGVLQGGKLVKKVRKMKVKGDYTTFPDEIVINIDNLNIGDYIKVKNIQHPGLTLLDDQNSIVVTVKATRASADAATKK